MNFGIFNEDRITKEFKKLESANATETKRLNSLINDNDKARARLSERIGNLQAEQRTNNDELMRLAELKKRPWALIGTFPRIHDTGATRPDFDRSKFDYRAALKALAEIDKRKCELEAENLVLLCTLEPLQAELGELNIESQSLHARRDAVRPPNWTYFEMEWKKMQGLQAFGLKTDKDYLGEAEEV